MSKLDSLIYKDNETERLFEAVNINYVCKPQWYYDMFQRNDIMYAPRGGMTVQTTSGEKIVSNPDKFFVIRFEDNGNVDLVEIKTVENSATLIQDNDSRNA